MKNTLGDLNNHLFAQLARLNQNHLIQDDVELTKTAINVVDLMCKISQVKKSNKR